MKLGHPFKIVLVRLRGPTNQAILPKSGVDGFLLAGMEVCGSVGVVLKQKETTMLRIGRCSRSAVGAAALLLLLLAWSGRGAAQALEPQEQQLPMEDYPYLFLDQQEEDSTHLSLRSSSNNDRSLQGGTAHAQECQRRKQEIEAANIASNGQPRITCSCNPNSSPPGTNLFCTDACNYCQDNDRGGVCGRKSTGAVFSSTNNGLISRSFQAFEYNRAGRFAVVFVRKDDCTQEYPDDLNVQCNTCSVFVDATRCNSCELVTCGDGRVEASYDCSNVVGEGAGIHNLCHEDLVIERNSPLEHLSPSNEANGNSFGVCYLGSRAFSVPRNVNPVYQERIRPPNTCTLQSNQVLLDGSSQCPTSPPPGVDQTNCDCYNYCGDTFVGCCAYNQDCSAVCGNLLLDLVAGCTFSSPGGDDSEANEVSVNATTLPPTSVPTTSTPTSMPTSSPTSGQTSHPTSGPTSNPTDMPTSIPTDVPTDAPTEAVCIDDLFSECQVLPDLTMPDTCCPPFSCRTRPNFPNRCLPPSSRTTRRSIAYERGFGGASGRMYELQQRGQY